MKRIRDIVLIVLSGLMLASCTEVSELMGLDRRVRLSQQTVSSQQASVMTRAAQNLNNGYIAEGDRVRVKITPSATSVTTDYSYTAAQYGVLESTVGTPAAYYPADGTIDIAAWAPWTFNAETFTVQSDQTADEDYKLSDLMFAAVEDREYSVGLIPLQFRHRMAKLNVNVMPEGGVTSVSSIRLKNVQRQVMVDMMTGMITPMAVSDEHPADDIVLSNNGAVVFPPQTLDGVFMEVVTPEGTALFAVAEEQFAENGEYTLNIYLTPAAFEETTLVGPWTGIDVEVGGSDNTENRLVIGTIPGDPFLWTQDESFEPKPVITYNYKDGEELKSRTLVENTDYKLAYFDNTQCGQATLLVKGLGPYDGLAAAKTFRIAQRTDGVIAFDANTTPTRSLSGNAMENVFSKEVTNSGDGRVTYTLSDNTCGATIDGAIVSFTKVGKVKVTATAEDSPNCAYATSTDSYQLTVVRGEAAISFADLTPMKTYNPLTEENSYTQTVVNSGDGTVGYTLSENTCGASVKGATVTFTKAGSVRVTATATDSQNFFYSESGRTASYVLTVSGLTGELTVTTSPAEYTYDGTKKTPAVTVKYGDKILTKDTDYTLSGDLSATDAGQYTITATGKGGYAGMGYTTWQIKPQSQTLTVTISPSNYTYDGSLKTPTVTVKCGTKTLTKDVDYTLSGTTSATDAGQYTITATGTGNYSSSGSAQWSIAKATPTVTAPTAKTGLIANGTAQTLINAGSTTGGTMQYSTNGSSYSTSLPTAISDGTYTVYYRVVGDQNYNDVAPRSISVKIAINYYGRVEAGVIGSISSVKIYTGPGHGYIVTCKDYDANAVEWSRYYGSGVYTGGLYATIGTKDLWNDLINVCGGGTGYKWINNMCKGVNGWVNMSGNYWTTSEASSSEGWSLQVSGWAASNKSLKMKVRYIARF